MGNRFRDALRELIHLTAERKGWKRPSRSVSRFEAEALLPESSVAKILSGERHTLDQSSINTLLDSLYEEGHGVLSDEERTAWHERLHVTRAVEMTRVHLSKQVNRNIRVQSFTLDRIQRELVRLFRETQGLWALDLIIHLLTSSVNQSAGPYSEDRFEDNRNDWTVLDEHEVSVPIIEDYVTIAGGYLTIIAPLPNWAGLYPAKWPSLTDGVASVVVDFKGWVRRGRHTAPRYAGLLLRTPPQPSNLERPSLIAYIGISPRFQEVSILVGPNVQEYQAHSTAINSQKENTLRIHRTPGTIVFAVNGAIVHEHEFPSTVPMQVGLGATDFNRRDLPRFSQLTFSPDIPAPQIPLDVAGVPPPVF